MLNTLDEALRRVPLVAFPLASLVTFALASLVPNPNHPMERKAPEEKSQILCPPKKGSADGIPCRKEPL